MNIFVQSRARSLKRDYYWVELLSDGTTRVLDARTPHFSYDELLKLIDVTSPSLIIAQAPSEDLLLLAKGIVTDRFDSSSPRRIISNNFLVVFQPDEEALARSLAVALLAPSQLDISSGSEGFNSETVQLLNSCIYDSPRYDSYEVSWELRKKIEELIFTIEVRDRARHHFLSGFLGAKNSLRLREELSRQITQHSLPARQTEQNLEAFIVVTGIQDKESLLAVRTRRMLTELIRNEDWHDFTSEVAAPTGATETALYGGTAPKDKEQESSSTAGQKAEAPVKQESDGPREARLGHAAGVREHQTQQPDFLQVIWTFIKAIFCPNREVQRRE